MSASVSDFTGLMIIQMSMMIPRMNVVMRCAEEKAAATRRVQAAAVKE